MNLVISGDVLEKVVQESFVEALRKSLMGHDVQSAIGKAFTQEIVDGAVAEALRATLAALNLSGISPALAREMERATTRAVVSVLQEVFIEVLLRVRGIPEYDREGRAREQQALRAQLFDRKE